MKNGKLLLLLVAILSLTVIFVACDSQSTPEESATVGSTAEATENSTDSSDEPTDQTQEAETETEQETFYHEMYDYFAVDNEINEISFADISKIDGSFYKYLYYGATEIDVEHNLLVVKTRDLDNYNNVIDTLTVYDVVSGEKLVEESVSNLLYEINGEKITTLDVSLDYPIIRVMKTSYGEDSNVPVYDYSYYFAKPNSEVIATTNKRTYDRVNCGYGLYAFTLGDEVVWVDKDMEIVRTLPAIAASGYDMEEYDFMGEYRGYVYAWNSDELQIFNRSGVCSATYKIAHDGTLNIHILNDGNVLIQDIELLNDAYGLCDFTINGDRCNVTSYIMNFIDGSLTEIDLEFIVGDLCSAYSHQACEAYSSLQGSETCTFAFDLVNGHQNQALIYRFFGGQIAHTAEYVCLDNSLKVEYTVKNSTPGIMWDTAYSINDRYYSAVVQAGGIHQPSIFDLDGNLIAAYRDAEAAGNFMVTNNAIYDQNMQLIYDFASDGYSLLYAGNDKICLEKYNYTTGNYECFIWDAESESPKMICDGEDKRVSHVGYGYYIVYDSNNDCNTLYGSNDDAILTAMGDIDVYECYGALVVGTQFNGEDVIYVIK